ncbi:MAG: amidohydrolase [Bacteroidetes bacterium]|nr:amidohydrolase [Bacteroidota bacterium]
MKDQISITLVQPDIVWEGAASNLHMLNSMLENRLQAADLLILPETFSTGFTMRAGQFAEDERGMTLNWMVDQARENDICVAGSMITREDGKIFNRLYWVTPEGIGGHYDKRHLFRMGREDKHFTQGESRVIFRLGEFRFLPQICYDLRFPVFARNRNDYDILFYVANWPAPRHLVWETLLRARAIENQAYVIGVSRSGRDGEGVDHLGGSIVVDPLGRTEHSLGLEPGVLNFTIELKKIREFREKFPVWKDADKFTLQ